MNKYRHLLDSRNISIVREVYRSLVDREVVGWLLTSPSVIRKNFSMGYVEGILPTGWIIKDVAERTNQFFVYNDKAQTK